MRRTRVFLVKEGMEWRLIINLGKLKKPAIEQARKLAKKLAPSELIPRRLDGTFDKDARETYANDPRETRG